MSMSTESTRSRCHSRTFADFCIIDCSEHRQQQQQQTKGKNSPSCPLALQRTCPLWGPSAFVLVYLIFADFTLEQVADVLTTAIEGSHPHSNFDLITRHREGLVNV